MKESLRSGRSLWSRWFGRGTEVRPTRTSRLAGRAGQGEHTLDALEERKLLFTLTITPDIVNPATGLGTVGGTWGYVLPYLFAELPELEGPDVVVEEFGDEMANWTMFNPPSPPSGTFFDQSEIRISYASQQTNPVRLVAGPDAGQQGAGDDDLRISLVGNDRMTFAFFEGVQENNPNPRLAFSTTITIRTPTLAQELPSDGNGLNTDPTMGSEVELLLDGVVVARFSGTALDALGTNVQTGIQYTFDLAGGFDSIRFSSVPTPPDNGTYSDIFILDDISVSFPPGNFADFIEDRVFGATLVFTGPAGATIQVLDLYGPQMHLTTELGREMEQTVGPIDRNDDGVPDFNDGIGRVIVTGTNLASSMSLYGGTLDFQMAPPVFELPMDPLGIYDDFEDAGFGYGLTNGNPPMVTGLPPGSGSVVIGSPFVRDNSSPEDYLSPVFFPVADDFLQDDQGVFVNGGASIGSVIVHGILHGSSNFTGAAGRLNIGYLPGSVTVAGDLGQLIVASDVALWVADDANMLDPQLRVVNPTNAQLVVGRTLGEFAAAGRSSMDVTVLADINNPNRARINSLNYTEREHIQRFNPATQNGPTVTLQNNINNNDDPGSQSLHFGAGYFRNDSLLSAEFVGYNATAVRITGSIQGADPVNTGLDFTDVFAFAADQTREVVIEGDLGVAYFRVVDRDGRVIAAIDGGAAGRGPGGNAGGRSVIRFTPEYADTFYLVVNNNTTAFGDSTDYLMTITGMAPVTLGALRSGAGSGGFGDPFFLSLGAGSMGSVRIGTGYVGGDGMENDTTEILNTNQTVDPLFQWEASTISVPGNLYNITTGGDVNSPQVLIGGNLGTFVTGLSPIVGQAVTQGDVFNLDLRTGGSIGTLDVRGGLAIDQDSNPDNRGGFVNIRTGISGDPGHIGEVLVGAYMSGFGFTLQTSNGSIIDKFIVGANNDGAGTEFPGNQIIDGTPVFRLGSLSDLRFADFNLIQRAGDADVVTPLFFGQTITFVDDAGASVSVRIQGGNGPDAGTSTGTIRVMPVDDSQGVAIARINVNLVAGAELRLTGVNPGVVSIGRIDVTSDSNLSNIVFDGAAEIDVWRINATGGPLNTIRNNTANGDIVAIDAGALREIIIGTGSLGRTQTSGVGRVLLGPFLGLATGRAGGVGAPLGVSPAAVNGQVLEGNDWDGEILIPINVTDYMPPAPLEDLGSPIDGYLDGVVVRGGDLRNVTVGGTVGDVIVEAGHLIRVVANADGVTPFGEFEGIEGNVYAVVIGTIDIGDGLRGTGPSPFAAAGIFADDDIVSIIANRVQGAVIRGAIVAGNITAAPRNTIGIEAPMGLPQAINGLDSVSITNGRYDGAFLQSVAIDDFWQGLRQRDVNYFAGPVRNVIGNNSDLFRSEVVGTAITAIQLNGGAFDGTYVNAAGNIGSITADEFRNTLRLGDPLEFHPNRIEATLNLGNLSTNGLAGDIADLTIDIGGSLTGTISARNIVRFDLQVDNSVAQVFATNDFRGSNITTGRLALLNVTGDIRSSTVSVSGPIEQILAGGEITFIDINSTGPDGRIDTIRSNGRLFGTIESAGPILTIQSINGDVEGSIRTLDASDGRIEMLSAGRDLLVDLTILGDAQTIMAGRNIGRLADATRNDLDIRGNLGTLDAGGPIYYDVFVGQSITGIVRNGAAVSLPNDDQTGHASIVAFGRIATLDLFGDFDGDIISHSGGIGTITITEGTFRANNLIAAYDGSINTITISGGHLLGNVYSDEAINSITVRRGSSGFSGHIGVANALRPGRPSGDPLRNQLPPGTVRTANIDGPFISARFTIGSITVEGGAIWEAGIFAGQSIGTVTANQIRNDGLTTGRNSFIAAGDSIGRIQTTGFVGGLQVIAGMVSLGNDNRPGGFGDAADVMKSGAIGDYIGGKTANTRFIAGIAAGSNGVYGDGNDLTLPGISSINSVSVGAGSSAVRAFADGPIGFTTPGVQRGGSILNPLDPSRVSTPSGSAVAIPNGTPFAITANAGENGTVLFSGPGQAFWDAGTRVLSLRNTTAASSLSLSSSNGSLTNVIVLSNNNAVLGTATVTARLLGTSTVFIDGGLGSGNFAQVDSTGAFGGGGDTSSLTFAGFLAGTLEARSLASLQVNGDFGRTSSDSESILRALNIGSVRITGVFAGNISSDRDVTSFNAGSFNRAGLRAGRDIGTITTGSLSESRISARDGIDSVSVTGESFRSSILAGVDLGNDAAFGGSGLAADVVTDGIIGPVTIGGNFRESDVSAGVYRGPDGFLGTTDDKADDGRSSIQSVTIDGNQVGSNFNSQQFRIISTGSVGQVLVAGNNFVAQGNFRVTRVTANPVPVQIVDLRVTEDSRVYTAIIEFNQQIDSSTLSEALSVLEVRAGGVLIGLAEGIDYSVTYDAANLSARITFDRDVTERDLPLSPGVPGPGVYRFNLSAAILRGASQGSILDGNSDGSSGDDYSADDFVGDVGDKINSGNPASDPSIDFYGAFNLNLVLDDNADSDDLPDANRVQRLRGVIGDHPDSNSNTFRTGGDADVYMITLRAGQILRLGAMSGVAQLAPRAIYDAAGNQLAANTGLLNGDIDDLFGGQTGGLSGPILRLPNAPLEEGELTNEDQFLVKETGTYYIVVAGNLLGLNLTDVNAINNNPPTPGAVGSYNFTVEVFDDGDSGFNGDTDSGNGALVQSAPVPLTFAGSDGEFGTDDDLTVFTIGDYNFTLNLGADGLGNTRDDVVTGTNGDGSITSIRRSGRDGRFDADDRRSFDDVQTSTINSAIGAPGNAGVPDQVTPDVDVFRLNGGQPIEPRTRIRATFRLTETGSNIGLAPDTINRELGSRILAGQDLFGDAQFAIFEIPSGGGFDDGRLVASPSDFLPIGGQPESLTTNGRNKYGYDANGDFFLEFITPGALGLGTGVPASYAIYIQGAIRSDYTLEVITRGRGQITPATQNVLLETRGGLIDWLEAGDGVTTDIRAFTTRVLGFSGQINGQDVDLYVLSSLITNLNDIFAAANARITISSEPAAFEGQEFSTVFLAGNSEPSQFFNNGTFGASEAVDAFNVNPTDEAVVFLTSLATLGNDPSRAGVDLLVNALTAAVARRIGELIGLRITTGVGGPLSPVDLMADNSVLNAPTPPGVFRFLGTDRDLSRGGDANDDTNFYLGQQNSLALLNRIIAPQI